MESFRNEGESESKKELRSESTRYTIDADMLLKKEYLIVLSVGMIASGAISNGLVIWQQGKQINEMMRVVTQDMYSAYQVQPVYASASSSAYAASAIKEGYVRIGQEKAEINGHVYSVEHWCNGSVFSGMDTHAAQAYQYCLGDNRLVSITTNNEGLQEVYVEAEMRSDLPADAPILFALQPVPTSSDDPYEWILVSFDQDPCITVGSCKTTEDRNHIAYAMHIGHQDHERHVLKNIPKTGVPHWNPEGKMAVILPRFCEDGCDPHALQVFDLEKDQVQAIEFSRTGSGLDHSVLSMDEFEWKNTSEFGFRVEIENGEYQYVEGYIK